MAVDFERIEKLLEAARSEGREALYEHEVYRLLRAAGATVVPRAPHHVAPASPAASSAPAAMDLVHRYAETRQPHGRTACGAS